MLTYGPDLLGSVAITARCTCRSDGARPAPHDL